jgi:hypothetical protein
MTATTTPLKHIDENRLEKDLGYRFNYLSEFMGFGPQDVDLIRASAPHLGPLVPQLVDAVYVKLFSYDATKRHLVPESVDALTQDHEQIQFRKAHLGKYLKWLVTGAYDGKMISYLDFVGKMHTPKAGSKDLNVPLVQMDALMGFVADALLASLLDLPLEGCVKAQTIRAFNKLLWLQNDLIVRHYAA